MKIKINGKPEELDWILNRVPVHYDRYAHASVIFGYERDGRFESLLRLTYQTDCEQREYWEKDRKGATIQPVSVAAGLDREWRGWYAESIEFESSGVSAQLAAAAAFAPVWARVQATIEDKNLHYKYQDDALAVVVAALNVLKVKEWRWGRDDQDGQIVPEEWSNWAWLK